MVRAGGTPRRRRARILLFHRRVSGELTVPARSAKDRAGDQAASWSWRAFRGFPGLGEGESRVGFLDDLHDLVRVVRDAEQGQLLLADLAVGEHGRLQPVKQ